MGATRGRAVERLAPTATRAPVFFMLLKGGDGGREARGEKEKKAAAGGQALDQGRRPKVLAAPLCARRGSCSPVCAARQKRARRLEAKNGEQSASEAVARRRKERQESTLAPREIAVNRGERKEAEAASTAERKKEPRASVDLRRSSAAAPLALPLSRQQRQARTCGSRDAEGRSHGGA